MAVSPPVTWEGSGLELEVDAVRIASVEELEALMDGQELRPYLDDDVQTIVTFNVTLRNTTADPVEWHAGGIQTAIVLGGQQGEPLPFLGDLGGTIRAEAEQAFQISYSSVVPVEQARAAGPVRWEVGNPSDPDTYQPVAEVGELTIPYEPTT